MRGNKCHILKYFETRKNIPGASRGALNAQPSGINTNSGLYNPKITGTVLQPHHSYERRGVGCALPNYLNMLFYVLFVSIVLFYVLIVSIVLFYVLIVSIVLLYV